MHADETKLKMIFSEELTSSRVMKSMCRRESDARLAVCIIERIDVTTQTCDETTVLNGRR